MQLHEVLRRPLITEKNTASQALGKYGFEVGAGASKHEIKQAVEKAFNVTVLSVNVMNVQGKRHKMGRGMVTSPSWKKAIVTLKPGDSIQFFEST